MNTTNIPQTIKEKIKTKRKKIWKSQKSFSYDCNVSEDLIKRIEAPNYSQPIRVDDLMKVIKYLGLSNDLECREIICQHYQNNPISNRNECFYLIQNFMVMPFDNWHQYYDSLDQFIINIFNWLDKLKRQGKHYEFLRQIWIDCDFYLFTLIYGYWNKMIEHLSWLAEKAYEYGDDYNYCLANTEKNWVKIIRKNPRYFNDIDTFFKEMIESFKYKKRFQEVIPKLCSNLFGLKLRQGNSKEAFYWINQQEKYLEKIDYDESEKIHHLVLRDYAIANSYAIINKLDKSIEYLKSASRQADFYNYSRASVHIAVIDILIDIIQKQEPEQIESKIYQTINLDQCQREPRCLSYLQLEMATVLRQKGQYAGAEHWVKKAKETFDHLGIKNNSNINSEKITIDSVL